MVQELRALSWDLSVHPASPCPVWEVGEEREQDQGREDGLGQLVPARSDSMPCPPTPNHSVCALS